MGYRYPASLRYLLYALSLSLATFCVVIISSNKIEDKATQTSLAVFTGVLAVLAGILGLWFHSTLLPIDFDSLDTYAKNQGIVSYFPRTFLENGNLRYALANSGLPEEVREILKAAAETDNYTVFIKTLRDLKSSDVGRLRDLIVNGKPDVPYALPKTLGERAKESTDVPKVSLYRRLSDSAKTLKERFKRRRETPEAEEPDLSREFLRTKYALENTEIPMEDASDASFVLAEAKRENLQRETKRLSDLAKANANA